jgi:hypothetical protein
LAQYATIICEMKTTWFTATLQKPGIGSPLDVPDEEHRAALNWGETEWSAGDLSVQFARASADPRAQGILCAIGSEKRSNRLCFARKQQLTADGT